MDGSDTARLYPVSGKMRTHSDGPQVKNTDRLITRTAPLGHTHTQILGFPRMKKTLSQHVFYGSLSTEPKEFHSIRTEGVTFPLYTAWDLAVLRGKRPSRVCRLSLYSRFFSLKHRCWRTNAHTYTHTLTFLVLQSARHEERGSDRS